MTRPHQHRTRALLACSSILGLLSVSPHALGDGGVVITTVTVLSGATLAGYGTSTGSTSNSGTVIPGGTAGIPGALTVGSYTQTSSGSLQIEVSPSAASRLVVNGNASLAGALDIAFDSGTYTDATYAVLTATGAITGSFANVAYSNLPSSFAASLTGGTHEYDLAPMAATARSPAPCRAKAPR